MRPSARRVTAVCLRRSKVERWRRDAVRLGRGDLGVGVHGVEPCPLLRSWAVPAERQFASTGQRRPPQPIRPRQLHRRKTEQCPDGKGRHGSPPAERCSVHPNGQEVPMSTTPTITSQNSSTSVGPCCLAEAVAEFEAAAGTLCIMYANANEHTRDAVYAAYLSLELPSRCGHARRRVHRRCAGQGRHCRPGTRRQQERTPCPPRRSSQDVTRRGSRSRASLTPRKTPLTSENVIYGDRGRWYHGRQKSSPTHSVGMLQGHCWSGADVSTG